MTRISIKSEILRWAIDRSRVDDDALHARFPRLQDWMDGVALPTMKQLEQFAKATRTPLGLFFLTNPPTERLPIKDFRSSTSSALGPSADLLDTVFSMQRRQAWLREELRSVEAAPLGFVGSAKLSDNAEIVGHAMRRVVGLNNGWASNLRSWTDAVGELRRHIEGLGVIAVINGVVGNDTTRVLSVDEFRGFALVDSYAPLIFVNGADAKSAQLFTLAHELAHIWLGHAGEGLSGFEGIFPGNQVVERFCDAAAAEFLVPSLELHEHWPIVRDADNPFEQLARHFKVSPIVAARRAMDLRLVSRDVFFTFYNDYAQRERALSKSRSGGNFYNTQNSRIGQNFTLAVIRAAREGRLSFKEAYALTDLRGGVFQEYGRRLGVPLP